jgi:hypothetical protein
MGGVSRRGDFSGGLIAGLPLLGPLSVRGIQVDDPTRAATRAKRPGDLPLDTITELWRSPATSFSSASERRGALSSPTR